MNEQRDFYKEAIDIAIGNIVMKVEKDHVVALWDVVKAMTLRMGELAHQNEELRGCLSRKLSCGV